MIETLILYLKVFAVGGAICIIGQILIDFTKLTSGKILVIFLMAGIVLESFGLFQPLKDFALQQAKPLHPNR